MARSMKDMVLRITEKDDLVEPTGIEIIDAINDVLSEHGFYVFQFGEMETIVEALADEIDFEKWRKIVSSEKDRQYCQQCGKILQFREIEFCIRCRFEFVLEE